MTFEEKLWRARQEAKAEFAKKLVASPLIKSMPKEDISELLVYAFDFSKQKADDFAGIMRNKEDANDMCKIMEEYLAAAVAKKEEIYAQIKEVYGDSSEEFRRKLIIAENKESK